MRDISWQISLLLPWASKRTSFHTRKLEGRNRDDCIWGLNEGLQSPVENQRMLIDLNVYCLTVLLMMVYKALHNYPALPFLLPLPSHLHCSLPDTLVPSHPGLHLPKGRSPSKKPLAPAGQASSRRELRETHRKAEVKGQPPGQVVHERPDCLTSGQPPSAAAP